jgi:hypothetical protein
LLHGALREAAESDKSITKTDEVSFDVHST